MRRGLRLLDRERHRSYTEGSAANRRQLRAA